MDVTLFTCPLYIHFFRGNMSHSFRRGLMYCKDNSSFGRAWKLSELVVINKGGAQSPTELHQRLLCECHSASAHSLIAEEGHFKSVTVSVRLDYFGERSSARSVLCRITAYFGRREGKHGRLCAEESKEEELLLHFC